jgi:hypothetical protein
MLLLYFATILQLVTAFRRTLRMMERARMMVK